MKHPYIDLPDHQLWPSAMTTPAPGHINPALEAKSKITNKHQIATMGSCFAQHLAKQIRIAGFNYLVTEKAPDGTDPFVANKRNFGMFSARYGNVYTPRQAVQLFDRAFSRFVPAETFWKNGDRYLDPFRPSIEPEGFLTRDELAQDVGRHLACVREVFLKANWFIFTLGLTEAWRSKLDGAVYPIAPGVAGGIFSLDNYEFINFSVEEASDDISRLRNQLYEVNPAARMILTVSPVPLVATYEDRHVWVSTTYSKAVLRVAAEQAVRHFDNVEYFPSYEVITSPAAGFRYFDDDLRSVTEQGVKHVMRVFFRNYCQTEDGGDTSIVHAPSESTLAKDMEILCDEDLILSSTHRPQESINSGPVSKKINLDEFDEQSYLKNNPDVARAVATKKFESGWQHYVAHGRAEGRKITYKQ